MEATMEQSVVEREPAKGAVPTFTFHFNARSPLKSFYEVLSAQPSCILAEERTFIEHLASTDQILSSADRQKLLNLLSHALLLPCLTLHVVQHFRPILIELVARWMRPLNDPEERKSFNFTCDCTLTVPTSPKMSSGMCIPSKRDAEGQPLQDEDGNPRVAGFAEVALCAISEFLVSTPQVHPYAIRIVQSLKKEGFLQMISSSHLPSDSFPRLRRVIRAIYRIVSINRISFAKLLSWFALFGFVSHQDAKVQAYAIHTLATILEMSASERDIFLKKHIAEDTKDFELSIIIPAIEEDIDRAARSALLSHSQLDGENSSMLPPILISSDDLSNFSQDVAGVLIPCDRSDRIVSDISQQFVLTPTARENLHNLALAISMNVPIMTTGSAGCGKTALIEQAAALVNQPHLMKIHLGDQTDAKLLLGTYICTSTPGEFIWQDGILTTAVEEGRWILFEDFDSAPVEVISVLRPLLESGWLSIPSRGARIQAKAGFRIFATQQSENRGSSFRQTLGESLWYQIDIKDLPTDEISDILAVNYPELGDAALVPSIMRTFLNLQRLYAQPMFGGGRGASLRDLLKWCRRISHLHLSSGTTETTQRSVSRSEETVSRIGEGMLREAIDCFVGAAYQPEIRQSILNVIGESLDVVPVRLEYLFQQFVPSYSCAGDVVEVGRVQFKRKPLDLLQEVPRIPFALAPNSLRLMEKIAVCIDQHEPILLVGETGTGKTTVVQHLAHLAHTPLTVINMSQQSDSSDLLGGFKPVDIKLLSIPVLEEFDKLFSATFSVKANMAFLSSVKKAVKTSRWKVFVKACRMGIKMAQDMFTKSKVGLVSGGLDSAAQRSAKKSKLRNYSQELESHWQQFASKVTAFEVTQQKSQGSLLFSFIEGALVRAMKEGHWVLLDEINLASPETLDCLTGLLASTSSSVILLERGDHTPVIRHKNFRIFGCMNPANDAGKRNLAPALRTRFTEFWVDAPDANFADLLTIVRQYLVDVLPPGNVGSQICQDVGEFYTEVRRMASEGAVYDGADHTVHYSMRTLARALLFATWSTKKRFWDLRRGLWEGCSMTFTTGLSASSRLEVLGMLKKVLGGRRLQPARQNPDGEGSDHTISVAGYWLPLGPNSAATSDSLSQSYVLTPTVTQNLSHLARAVMSGKYPVLIQGPTSAGKTSMVEYLAKATGHTCVRVNNHEGTDISEYIGGWGENDADGDQKGQLVWQEGILVSAVKNGYWLILDELNLAPSEVLESLNRLLDDNRELFIPETQQVIRPHPNFMLFATQNPAGTTYGGRKQLSRAFRNRFLEIHFNDIPSQELHTILESRCGIAPSYAERIVAVYKALQSNRGRGRVFEGRHGFVTLRDLFRWGSRECIGYQQLAEEGWCLLGERMRTEADRVVVKEVIEKEMKVALNVCEIYENGFRDVQTALESLFSSTPEKSALAAEMVWTPSTKRLFTLVWKCVQNNEPVLLVGDTGAGKTTVCQIIAALCGRDLRILNAHQGSEVSDFIGGNRPVRGREQLLNDAYAMLHQLEKELDLQESDTSSQPFSEIAKVIDQELANRSNVLSSKELKERLSRAVNLYDQSQTLFTWKDGPLTTALREGSHFLLDEISLADDSVLERMNSVLETSQFLLLAEKGRAEALYASPGFRFLATMNPGGDYGKKELSPALRNRFCELWVPGVTDRADLTILIHAKLTKAGLSDKGANDCTKWMMDFYDWLCDRLHKPRNVIITLRDVLSWVDLLAHTHLSINLTLPEAFFHGGCMVIVDGISINPAFGFSGSVVPLQNELRRFLWQLTESALVEPGMHEGITTSEDRFGVHPFYIGTGPHAVAAEQFSFDAPTTLTNLSRVLRALQLPKPVLLEGSPGVGKTSLISTLAKKTGHRLTRINLSDQTDLTDLFGTDLPTEGTGNAGRFSWRDGPFLNAMKRGEWVLLDELNLATQQVLEGLNACLDHRGEVYLPELDRVFKKGAGFRVFAAQNPQAQGGGRKGLPRSFLNRFTNVYIEVLTEADMTLILSTLYPTVDESILAKMVRFNERIKEEAAVKMHFASRGSPWEYNLRDIHRWVELLVHSKSFHPRDFVRMMYTHRMRTLQDRTAVIDIYNEIFEDSLPFSKNPEWHLSPERVVIGCAALDRLSHRSAVGASSSLPIDDLNFLPSRLSIMESLLKCVELKYMPILVGAGGSGKTSLVRLLAGICGATLVEFNLNPAVDSVELLGGFEQVDISRRKKAVVDTLGSVVELIVRSLCTEDVAEDITVAHRLQETWINISGSMTSYSSTQEAEMFVSELEVLCNRKLFVLKHLRPDVFTDIRSLILLYKDAITTGAHGSFEWVDGSLIRAMENGHWILFDNVNLCPAAVLDRLNPLLERAGTLTVSERGLDEKGQVRTIESNGNFRIFMAMNDRYGEISRAMRNRGVELFVGADPEHAQVSNVPDELLSLLSDMGMQESTMLGKIFMEQLQRGASWQDVIYSPAIQVQTKRVEMDHSFLPELSPSGISVRLPPGKLIISYTQLANVMQDAAMLSSVIQSAAPQEFTRDNLLASSVKVFLEGLVSDKDMKIRESWLQYLKQAILQPDDLSGSTTLDMLLTILKSDDLISLLQSRSTNRSNTLLPLRLTLSSQSVLPECTESDKLEIRKDSTGILIALTRILCTQYLEMQVMQKTSDTVLHRSKAYAAGRLGESDLDHPCVAFIWELLQKLIEFSKFWLVGNAEDSQTIDLVMHLLEQRDSLWTVAHSSVLRLDELRVVSRRIYKTASFCIARMTVSDTGRELSEVVTQILNAIGITDRLDSVLWGTRNGSILNNRDLVHLEGEMLTCDQRLDVWKVANFNALQSPGLITDIKVRRELMDGISTLYYIGNSANLEVGLIDLLQKLPDALNKVINLTEYKMAGSLAEENEECRNAMELESASAQLSQTQFKHYEQRVLRMAGYALNDKIILQNELFLLDRLAYFADGSCSEDPVKLLFDVTEHLDLALLASSRSPAQLVPLKRIAWILERLNSDSNLTPIDAKAGIRHMLPEASFRWHQYLWRNGTSFWSEALREQDAVQLLAACAWQRLDEMTTLNRQSSSDLAGPTLLQYDVESRVSFSTLFALDDVPLYACDTKLQQLVNVRQTYAELPRHEDAQRSEMKRILSNLQQMLADVCGVLTSELGQSLNDAMSEFCANPKSPRILLKVSHLIDQLSSAPLRDNLRLFLLPCMEILSPANCEVMPSIGLSWVYFAVLSLRLYIPRVPNDPAAIPGIKLRFSEQKTAALEAELFVRRMCEQAFTGNKENQITQRLAIEMQAWQRKSAKWRKHVAYRPEDSQITALFNDLHQLVYQVANIQTLEKIFEVDPRSGNVEPISFEQERAMQGTLESFVDRMEVKYPLYQDLLHPVKLAVYQLKFGLRLWRDQIESSQLASRQIERKLVNWAATFMDTDPQGSKVFSPKMLDTESRFDVNLRVELLATFLERICSIAGLRGKSRLSDIGGAHEVLSAIVDAWTFTEKKRLEDERIAQEFYIHKEQKHEVQSEDEIDRHRFQDIFPDYADDYTSDNVVTEGTGETEKPNISEVSSIVGEDTFGESVVNYHQQLLYSWTEGMAKPDEFPASWSSAFKRSYSGAASLIRTFGDDKMKMTTMDVGSHAFMASVQENALTSSRNDDTSLYDFYADSNILEVRQILPLLNRLMTRLHQLLEQWPGQEVLLQLAAINHRILGFAITSPVMKFLTGLELLLQRSNDWEAYASKEASLKESLTEITESIVKWRKLEISCWRELLDVEERRKHRAACKLWFQMWNLLMTLVTREYSSQPDDDSDSQKLYNELITNLDQFLITSPSGEFSSRLRMLESFYRHLTVMLQLSEGHQLYTMQHVRKILFHTHKYYQILEKGITETISKSRKPIWKELNDYVKIATWKDVNVFALKESAKKSHYHLHKFVKKYRAILEVPVQTLLQSAVVMGNISGREQKHLAKSSRQQARTTQAVVLPPGNGLQDLLQISGAKHFTNIPDFMVKMSQHMKVFESPDLQDSTSAILEDLVDTILSSVEEFQSETANTSDRTSKSAQGAKAIRRKALVDLLKRLRDLGLSFYSANKYKAQESPSYLFTLPVPLESPSTQTLELWQRCDHYFYTLLRRMTELRQTRHGASADLSRVEIERATSVIEHLWHINIADHRDIVSVNVVHAQLQSIMSQMELPDAKDISDSWLYPQDKFKSIMAIQKDSVDEVAIAFSQAVLLVETLGPHYTHLQRLRVALTECKAAVLTWKSTLDQQCEEYLNCSNPIAPRQQEVVLSLAKSVLVLSQCDEKLSSACTQDSQSTRNELFAGIVRNLELTVRKNKCHLDAALGMNEEITTALQEATTDSEYLDTVLQKADTLVKSVLLAFQDIVNEAELQLVSPESEQAILFSRSVRSRFLQSQRFGHVVKSLTSLLTLMDTSKASAERRVWVQIIGCLRPVVMQFSIALQARLEDSIRDHKSLLKTNYVLCNTFSELFKKGFCLPNEEAPTEDDGQEAPAVDGMGIGEGDGEKDVSDEIENQGQVEGMQDEKPADNTGQKLEDQPEGLEMDDDFDGQLEDLDLDPGSDDGQDEAEQENQLEDQMGDLDDSADVLDERLWGDEEKDHGENGKDDKMELDGNAGKSSSEIEMVANDVVSEDAPAPDPAKKAQENADKPTDPNENDDGEDAKHTEDNEVNEKDELEEHHNVDPKDAGKPQPVDDDDSADMDDDQSDEIKDRDDQDAALEFEEKNDPAESNLPPTNEETPGKDEEFGSDFEDNDMENAPAPDEVEDMSLDDEHALDDGEPEMAEDGENEETPEETPRGDEVEEASSLNALDKTEATNEDDADNSEDQTNPINEPLQDQQDSSAIAGDAGAANDTSDNQDQEGTTDGVAQQLQETAADNEGGQDVAPTQTGGDDQNDDSNKTPKGKNAGEMNPHRSLGDALQKWMSRINELESRVNQEDTPRPQEDNSSTSKNKNFEFVQNDQDAADAQALGDATAKQLAETDQAALADRDQEADYEHQDPASDSEQDDSMDVDHDKQSAQQKRSRKDNLGSADTMEEKPETPTEAAEVRVQEASKQKYNGRSEENPESASAGATNHAEDLAVAEENIIPLSTVQYDTMRHELEQWLAEWRRSGQDPAESQKLWQSYAALTRDLSFTLCEQLRLILEPTLATKLKGDYRTGKRLNMRKIVPYIASQFKKDKIWMRRTKPSKRSYQILLSIDDSRSMVESESVQLAFESLATITKALTQLESGDVGVISFGEDVKLLHPFDRPFTDESGADVLRRFSFAQERTNVLGMIRTAMDILSEAKMTSPMGGDDLWQLQLVISDGICEDHEQIRSVVRKAAEERIMVVFIILDNRGEKDSIVKMTNVTYDTDASSGRMMLQMNRYMDTFPFDYYVVVGNVAGLPEVLSDVLRQFFLFVNS